MNKGTASEKCFSLEGSYTVEAALVMSVSLFFIAALLTGIFEVHSRVVGNMALQEGLEQYIYTEENNWLAPSTPQKVFVFPKTVCAVKKLL